VTGKEQSQVYKPHTIDEIDRMSHPPRDEIWHPYRSMLPKIAKNTTIALAIFAFLNITLAVVTNVNTEITESDQHAFSTTLGLQRPTHELTFNEEIALIQEYQKKILTAAPMGAPIPEYQDREPVNLLRQGSGLCYDRSRALDKAYQWAGFKSRHVYILFLKDPQKGHRLSPLQAIFTNGIASHAVTEVKTQRGWMLVDSNTTWISINKNNEPEDADKLNEKFTAFESMPTYFSDEYIAIRGLYSRRGQFYKPHLPYPEVNWPNLMEWLLEARPEKKT
jgi:Transglutaminase-like superfamily